MDRPNYSTFPSTQTAYYTRSNRPSMYRKQQYATMGDPKANYEPLSPGLWGKKEAEKKNMQQLNDRLVNYVDKVHDLETANNLLLTENERLRQMKGQANASVGMTDAINDEINKLHNQIEDLQGDNTQLGVDRDNYQYDYETTANELERQKALNKDAENQLANLRKEMETYVIERSAHTTKIDNLQGALDLHKKVHQTEVEGLRDQIQPVSVSMVSAEPNNSSILPDLTDTISNIRRQYESFNAKSLEDLDQFHKEKIDNLNRQLKLAQDEIKDLRADAANKRKKIHTLQLELDTLKGQNDGLQNHIGELSDRLARERRENQDIIDNMNQELDKAKVDMGNYFKDYQKLAALALSMEQEVAIYHKVLTGEEDRISEIDLQNLKQDEEQNRNTVNVLIKSAEKDGIDTDGILEEMLAVEEESAPPPNPNGNEVENLGPQNNGAAPQPRKRSSATVRPVHPFKPEEDAESLHKAMKGFGTDEEVITFILANRSREQRHVIAQAYWNKYNKNLSDALDSDLSGNYKIAVQFLMWKKTEIDARAVRKSIKGAGTDEELLIEILCSMSSRNIVQLKMDYAMIFEGRSLEKDVEKDTSGKFKALLLAILKAKRPADSGKVSATKAEEDAKALFDMKVKFWSPLNPKFVEIFTERTFQHIRYMFKTSWTKLSKDDLLETIEKECSGDLKRGIMTLVRYSTCSTSSFYASELRESMKGLGTADNQLIYIITTRCEIDLVDIKEEYKKIYKETLDKEVSDETSGDYRKILLALVD